MTKYAISYHRQITGEIEVEAGDFVKAIEEFLENKLDFSNAAEQSMNDVIIDSVRKIK